ncbi:MAG: M14 metallopeptidase family protein [Pyrinomonadaceae bacterium]
MFRHRAALTSVVFALLLNCSLLPSAARAQSLANTNPPSLAIVAPPSPRDVLGFTPGDDRTIADWKQISDYFRRLDAASDRVQLETLGQTTLGRPFIVAYISAEENIRNLPKYKEIARRLADPRTIRNESERDQLIRDGRTVVSISCSIHSTEIVASQMSMQLAYELASAQDADTREILQNTILILIPSANPDGVDIIADWYRKTLNTPHEGTEPPVLYHHYAGHDNNRDWFMLNLKETQLVTRLFWKEWFPQIVYDVHQQGSFGSRFFIPPFYDPPNPRIAPVLLRQVGLIGHKVAADLQAAGHKGVVTNAMYDTWWHGGFRTAPYYHNSIGILSEAASARLMSPVKVTPEQLARSVTRGMPNGALQLATNFPDPWPGGEWRARDIMNIELIASRSILSMAAKYRADYLRNFYELGSRAIKSSYPNEPVAYLIPAGQGRDEASARIIGLLIAQGIEVHRLEREFHYTSSESFSFERGGREIHGTNNPVTREAPAGSYVVFLAQPYKANVQALFERQVYPNRRTAGGEAERPYDVAGWTLPMQMGIEVVPALKIRETATERKFALVRDEAEARRDLSLSEARDNRSPISNPIKNNMRIGLYKSWMNSMDEGWTRWTFDTFNVPYQSLLDKDMRAGDLRAKYDVIVLPSMRIREIVEGRAASSYPAEYTGGITEAGVENLRRFVEAGGTLLCFDASTELAIKRFNLPVRNVLEGLKSSEFYCPGSILRIKVDTKHPIARGMRFDTDAYFINSAAFEVPGGELRARVLANYSDRDVLRSGWLLGEDRIKGKAALVEVTMGRGRVLLFGFRPQHRGQTWDTFPFIWNAINQNAER